MSIPLSIPPPAREWLANWLHALAARLTAAREHLRERVVSAVGDTVAEAVESVVRILVRTRPWPQPSFGHSPPSHYGQYDDGEFWDGESLPSNHPSTAPAPEPPNARWRSYACAGLQAAAWWLRRRTAGPLLAAVAAMVGAALLLFD